MWPWGHLAVGYLVYSLWLGREGRSPDAIAVLLLGLGTQLPDLVDKPLAWELGVLEAGRSLGHSVLIGVVVLGVLYRVAGPRIGRDRVTAFGVGYLSHAVADLPASDLVAGEFATSAYLVWPLRSVPPEEIDRSIIEYLLAFQPGPFDYLQGVLVLLAVVRWYQDGRPGLGALRSLLRPETETPTRR